MEAKFQITAVRKEFKNGGNGWQVFVEGMEGNLRCEMNFREPLKAMRYMFGLSKQLGVQVNKVSLAALSIEYQTAKAQTESHEGENNTGEQDSSSEESAPEELVRKPNTVLVSQYEELKRKHPDALLLFRCGDFYECYDEDAKIAADILAITLTVRSSTGRRMAGFPFHELDTYLPRLIRAGQRVAICDQLEDPMRSTKPVKRGITELVSPKGV